MVVRVILMSVSAPRDVGAGWDLADDLLQQYGRRVGNEQRGVLSVAVHHLTAPSSRSCEVSFLVPIYVAATEGRRHAVSAQAFSVTAEEGCQPGCWPPKPVRLILHRLLEPRYSPAGALSCGVQDLPCQVINSLAEAPRGKG